MVWTGIEVVYTPGSPHCRALLMCIKALGLEVEYRKIDMYNKAEHKMPWFVKMNPQHCVPTIDDNGFVLWESRAIMQYLVSKYGRPDHDSLYPKDDHQQRALIDRILYFDMGTLNKSIQDYFGGYIMSGTMPELHKANSLKQALDYLDGFLEKSSYVAGEALTVADLCVLATVTQLECLDYSYQAYSNVKRWVGRLKAELPYYSSCNDQGIAMFRDWIKSKK